MWVNIQPMKHLSRSCIMMLFLSICVFPCPLTAQENPTPPLFSFGVIADIQYCDCDSGGSRHYRASLHKLQECVQDFNTRELAFVIQLGDFIDRDFASFDVLLPIYRKLTASTYHVLGNHDYSIHSEEKDKILKKVGLKRGYYDFTYRSWRFIVLDGNDLSFYTLPRTSEKYPEAEAMYQQFLEQGRPQAQTWNGGLSTHQMTWVKNSLEEAAKAGEYVILFCHFPVFPRPNMHNLWNDREVIKLLESYKGVVAYMNGHNHAGNYRVKNGIHYLTLKAMVETPDKNAYAIVEVYADHLNIIGRDREPNRVLSIR